MKIQIMELNKFYLKMFGINLENIEERSWLEKIQNILLITPLYIILLASIAYLLLETNNVTEMTDCVYTASGFVLLSSWYLIFIKQKWLIHRILVNLENKINSSTARDAFIVNGVKRFHLIYFFSNQQS